MTKDEALDLALKALKCMYVEGFTMDDSPINKAITAIKQARSAPVQPVISAGPITPAMQAGPTTEQKEQMVRSMQSAYPAAQPAPTLQEPVAWMDGYRNIYSLEEKAAGCEDAVIPLVPAIQHWSDCAVHNEPAYPKGDCDCNDYSTPPAAQRPWIGLTDEEILEVLCIWPDHDDDPDDYMEDIREARAIEAKLREKNT